MQRTAAAISAGAFYEIASHGQETQGRILASINIADNPDLQKVGGSVLLENTPVGKLLVIQTSENVFVSLSPLCPHRKCEVRVLNPSMIRCPCHQSSYKIDGTYVSGPAKASLRKYVTRVEGGTITALEN